MAYTQATSGPSGEVQKLQDEITREVNADAQHLATSVFGKPGSMPDIARVSDDTLDGRFRQAYESGNRQWLLSEAQRDPEQFVKVARRIGVRLPEETGQPALSPLPTMPAPAPPPLSMPAPPPPPPGGVPAPVPLEPPPVQVAPVAPPVQVLPGPPPQPAVM